MAMFCVTCHESSLKSKSEVFAELSPVLFPSDSGLGRNSRGNATPKLKVRILAVGFQPVGHAGRRDQCDYSWKMIHILNKLFLFECKRRQNLSGDKDRTFDICSSLFVDCVHCLTIKCRADLTAMPPEEAQHHQETRYYAKRGLIVFPPGTGLAWTY